MSTLDNITDMVVAHGLNDGCEEEKPAAPVEGLARCYDCAAVYPFGLDLVLPDQQWKIISPRGDLLCASCICKRAEMLGGATSVLGWINKIDYSVPVPAEWGGEPHWQASPPSGSEGSGKMNDEVPTTDDEVEAMIRTDYGEHETFKRSMHGIYKCRRGMGDSVEDAYIYMLRCHVDPAHPSLSTLANPPVVGEDD